MPKFQVKSVIDSNAVNLLDAVAATKGKAKAAVMKSSTPVIMGEYETKELAITAANAFHKEYPDTHFEVLRIATVFNTAASSNEGHVLDF